MTPRSTKPDANQQEIVDKCRQAGMLIIIQSQYRGHDYDLLIGHNGLWLIFEVKQSEKSKLTDNEVIFGARCKNKGLPIYYVSSFEEIVRLFNYEKYERIIK